ncbi:BLUF domain-containing protein [Azospirillum sp. A1-3]|uniref:BLUF domain-containing protein n=1 Tax=Azospirillum sp. A1-3 TaxID=185874 RepID=UPI00336BF34B
MHRLVLRSELMVMVSYDEIVKICLSYARRNKEFGVTGFLIECGGVFLCSLEGPPTALNEALYNIESDEKQRNTQILFYNETASNRLFGLWAMNMMFLDDPTLWQRAIGTLKAYDGFYIKSYDAAFAIGVLILSYRHACEVSHLNAMPSEEHCGKLPLPSQILRDSKL